MFRVFRETLNLNLCRMVTLNVPRMNRPRVEKSSGAAFYRVTTKPGRGAPQAVRARTAPSRTVWGARPCATRIT